MSNVEVNANYLAELEKSSRKLKALEQGGVDNWEWYHESLANFFKEEDQKEILNDAVSSILEFLTVEADIYEPAGRGAGYTIDLDKSDKAFKQLILTIINEYNAAGDIYE